MSLESGSTLWLTVEDADEYFSTRLGAAEFNDSGVDKLGALMIGQSDIESADGYDFADYLAAPTANMQRAVCEQAWFRLKYPEAEERAFLRAQGVIAAGVVGETYRNGPATVPLSPKAVALLSAYRSTGASAFPFSR